ncbi:MAG: hypothetical protein HY796_11665, partial [Elusimicrobia bacterium]|nr:hypothetical protein [Elusimicrobiota bacterium]
IKLKEELIAKYERWIAEAKVQKDWYLKECAGEEPKPKEPGFWGKWWEKAGDVWDWTKEKGIEYRKKISKAIVNLLEKAIKLNKSILKFLEKLSEFLTAAFPPGMPPLGIPHPIIGPIIGFVVDFGGIILDYGLIPFVEFLIYVDEKTIIFLKKYM